MVVRGWEVGEWALLVKGYKLSFIKLINSGDLTYSMVIISNNTLLYA